jgi:hypothetical protein
VNDSKRDLSKPLDRDLDVAVCEINIAELIAMMTPGIRHEFLPWDRREDRKSKDREEPQTSFRRGIRSDR